MPFSNSKTVTDNFYSALAVYDFYSNTTSYKNQVTAYFATATFQPNGDNKWIIKIIPLLAEPSCWHISLVSVLPLDYTFLLTAALFFWTDWDVRRVFKICRSDKTYTLVFSFLGIYAIRAYRTYGDSAMLDLAIQVWEFCRSYTISPTDVSTGSIATKSFNIAQSCSGGACSFFISVWYIYELSVHGT